jgi:hypothetical protein
MANNILLKSNPEPVLLTGNISHQRIGIASPCHRRLPAVVSDLFKMNPYLHLVGYFCWHLQLKK